MIVLLTGATGFIGRLLAARLAALPTTPAHRLRILTRNLHVPPGILPASAAIFPWSGAGPVPEAALDGVDSVCHLAGENIGAWPWTAERKRRILDSRVLGTRALVESLGKLRKPPSVFVAASALGYYGDAGAALRRETDGPGTGFLAQVVRAWEAEIFKADRLGMRTVAIRSGLVLGRAGALAKMAPVFRLGLGSVLGTGRQYWSWIHVEDTVGIFMHALEQAGLSGAVNGCAPSPTTQGDFSRTLAQAVHRPLLFKAPGFALRLALGEMADTLLQSQNADAEKILASGYRFRFPALPDALADILAPGQATGLADGAGGKG